jgi:hypothetical protein
MGRRASEAASPDLFSTAFAVREPPSPSVNHPKSPPRTTRPTARTLLPRHALPSNLPSTIKHLDDQELDRLFAAVLAELERRGRKSRADNKTSRSRRVVEDTANALTTGKLNAVRAAFKAGVTTTQIARQFGISLSDVRKALAP